MVQFTSIFFACWISSCFGANYVLVTPPVNTHLGNVKVENISPPVKIENLNLGNKDDTKNPRCLTSLFTWYAKKKVTDAMGNFDLPNFPDFRAPPGTGLQGGVVAPGSGGSHFTPDLSQANNALKDAQNMESDVNNAQALLNSQLAGVPNSGIPLSPSQFRGNFNGGSGFLMPEWPMRYKRDTSMIHEKTPRMLWLGFLDYIASSEDFRKYLKMRGF